MPVITESARVSIPVMFGLLSLVALAFRLRTRRRVAQDEARGGCVACGSLKVRIEGDTVTCEQCHYMGRADRGGTLARSEFEASRRDPPA